MSVIQGLVCLYSLLGFLDSLTHSPWQHPLWHRFELEGNHGCAASAHQEMRTCLLYLSTLNFTPPFTAPSSGTYQFPVTVSSGPFLKANVSNIFMLWFKYSIVMLEKSHQILDYRNNEHSGCWVEWMGGSRQPFRDQNVVFPVITALLCLNPLSRPGTPPSAPPNPHSHPQCTWSKARAAVNLASLLS